MSFDAFIFYVVATLTGLCAVAVVVTQNIVRSAAWLLFTLAGTSAIFFLLGADFVAATQLIVYVGGTLVLVVFGVMLTAQGPFITMKSSPAEWAITIVVGLLFLGVLVASVFSDPDLARANTVRNSDAVNKTSTIAIGESLLGVEDATPRADMAGGAKGRYAPERQRMSYLLPFEIVSVHLLVVLVGAAYLARAKRRRGAIS
jgi:NADH-quinone oxidoreductase subunit J